MNRTIKMLAAVSFVYTIPAFAEEHQWWTLRGECVISKFAPAEVFEKTEPFGTKLVDKGAGRVNIAVPDNAYNLLVNMANQNGWTWTFFRTESDCKNYLTEQSAAERQQEQERNKALSPYR